MCFRFDVNPSGAGWRVVITCPDNLAWPGAERIIEKDPEDGYPLPPQKESASWPAPCQPLCVLGRQKDRSEVYDLFLQSDPRTGNDVEAFGGYLFAVLLGDDWKAIGDAANLHPVRLQLAFPADSIWNSLPWELMVGPNPIGPLASFGKSIAITRVVTSSAPAAELSIEIPIRVLFVVGREIDNQLRPGAEYLGLLRQFQCNLGNQEEAKGTALHTRLLMEASSLELENAVIEFKPAVVHLISHGQMSGKSTSVILTRYEGPGRKNPKSDPVDAERLAGLLHARAPGERPHAVVLNACDTARIGRLPVAFAAELVQRGIPMVVGMAGEVADSACRLFARQFYEALIAQKQPDIAAAEGRRAAMLHFRNYSQNFDWARAVFFQADGMEISYRLQPLRQSLIKAAETLRPKKKREPFCGRLNWLSVFRNLCQRRIANLAIESEEEIATDQNDRPRIGKTRLLEEVQWQSVLEGWIPVLIDQSRPRFSNLAHWAVILFELIEKARETFGLDRANKSEIVRMTCDRWGVPYLAADAFEFSRSRDQVLILLSPQQDITQKATYDSIRIAVQADMQALRQDIENAVGPRLGVLLLWDQLDRHEGLEEDFVGLLNQHGLGTLKCPIPTVLLYVRRSAGGKKLVHAINDNADVEPHQLYPFHPGLEREMVSRQFLGWKKLVPSRTNRKLFDVSIKFFEDMVDGYPSRLYAFDTNIQMLTAQEVLIECDDIAILRQYR